MSKKTLSKLSAMVLSLGLVTGCATSSQLKQLEADIAKAQQTAADALVAANDAKAAGATAAMDAATAAQNAADDCSERCDRMMQKAMSK